MLYLVRHGRTAANAAGLLLGRLDVELDDEGERQARALAAVVPGDARIVSSPLLRTRATAQALASGRPVETDERWIELDYGDLDGKPLREVPAAIWTRWRADPGFAPPGGESLRQLGRRVAEACESLVESAGDGNVIVVSHVSPIKAAVAWSLDVSEEVAWRMFIAPASITTIAIGGNGPALHSFNEVTHLA